MVKQLFRPVYHVGYYILFYGKVNMFLNGSGLVKAANGNRV